jgi:hypothetical protein
VLRSWPVKTEAMQDAVSVVLRIHLLRGSMNKSKKKRIGRSLTSPSPAAFSAAKRYSVCVVHNEVALLEVN